MNSKNYNYFLAILSLIFVTSCGAAQRLDVNKKAPDEYLIVKQPPLVVPKNFTLPAPIDSSADHVKSLTEQEVDAIIYQGQDPKKATKNSLSKSDKNFIKKSEKHKKEKNIKQLVQHNNQEKKKKGLFS